MSFHPSVLDDVFSSRASYLCQPSSLHIASTISSQLPSRKRSRKFSFSPKRNPSCCSFAVPTISLLINTRGVFPSCAIGNAIKELNGATFKLVPRTIRQSAFLKSGFRSLANLSGRSSPKNTISGDKTLTLFAFWDFVLFNR